MQTLRHGIGRLIDSYAEGLIDKEQFEPRVRRLKERIALLEADAAKEAAALAEQQSLRLVMGQMDDFVATVKDRLSDLDWETRRAILRALVKRVEVDHTHIRVVFRVGPAPLVFSPTAQFRKIVSAPVPLALAERKIVDPQYPHRARR